MYGTPRTLAGRYELTDMVGAGGMGTVYRATDLVLRRTVAVKLLAGALLEDPVGVARFEREARLAASLADPAVVRIYDTGVDEGTHFIVMEFVPGRSLAELIGDHGRLDVDRALRIAGRVAGALHAAHAAGLVHRDIKPANVMVSDDGEVKVLDFGIARALDGTALTQTSSVVGSAAYMSPEQALGERADARSDIYSLGCLIYALLTGGPPFAGEAALAITHQHVNADPVPLRQLDRQVSSDLDALVTEMLSKSPGARPQTAAEVRDRLAAVASLSAESGAVGATEPLAPPAGVPVESAAVAPTARMPVPAEPIGALPAAGHSGHDTHRGDRRDMHRGHSGGSGRRRRVIAAAFGLGLAAVVLVVIVWASDRGDTAGAGRTGTSTGRSSTTAATAARQGASSPAAGRAPATGPTNAVQGTTTVQTTPPATTTPSATTPAAAGAVSALIGAAAAAGAISSQAASALDNGLAAVVSSLEAGNSTDAAAKLSTLTQTATTLESQGQISPAAAMP